MVRRPRRAWHLVGHGLTSSPWLPLVTLLSCSLGACDSQGDKRTTGSNAVQTEAGASMDSPFSHPALDQRLGPGGEYRDADFLLMVEGAKTCRSTAPFLPAKGQRRVSVSLTVESLGHKPLPLSPLNFRVVDAEGHYHGATLAGCEKPLDRQSLRQGDRATGAVAFDLPEAAQELKLQFEPFLVGRPPVAARLPLNVP